MTGLLIFVEIALAGCAFLLYFLFMLWRDSRKAHSGQPVEIKKLTSRPGKKAKVLYLHNYEEGRISPKRKARL